MTSEQKQDNFAHMFHIWENSDCLVWDENEDTEFNRVLNAVCPKSDPSRESFLAEFSAYCDYVIASRRP